ncbi:MAG: chemotaxis protein CheA [Nitrospirae bacterium]|nr:chemotaxis protein CheA [Nitrospirota bacterium]
MNDEMEEIISEFITEAEESLDRIEPLFVELEQKGEDKELLNDIFRSMHTIKGAAGFLGFQPIVDVAHTSENIMKKLREGEISISKKIMDVILKSVDMLKLLLAHLKNKDGIEENVAPLVKELESALNNAISVSGGIGEAAQKADPVGTAAQEIRSSETAEQLTAAIVQTSEEPKPRPDITVAADSAMQESEEKVQASLPEDQKLKEAAQKPKDTAHNLRVDIERIDKVMDLAGEVVLVRNRLLNISNYFDQKYSNDSQTETLMETVSFLDRVTSDLQLAVMKIRMQPIKKVLSKFPRLVRDMSASVNKDVELIIYGEGTEVDKSVIEHIGDPLTHIMRNSLDHGLEPTEERLAKGKPAKGKIIINIFQKGNQIVIEISDDGKGMDVENLKRKAVEKGLLTEEEANKMSDDAATEIIFMPGFSTKEVATELSGRGVGMDVVKTNISLLNGYVEISTEKNVGTTFRICIPLTLAIIQALMVEVSGCKYAIPLSPIEETLKISKKEINNITGQNVIVIRDKICPLFELNSLLGNRYNGHEENESDHKYIVVIALGDKRFCIAVDKLLGQEEVVIKTLDGIDTTSSNVLGATITGDGKVVFILDVTGMSRNLLGSGKG